MQSPDGARFTRFTCAHPYENYAQKPLLPWGWGPALGLVCAGGIGGSTGEVLVPAPRDIKRGDAHLKRLITAVSESEETGSCANLLVEV